MLRWQTCHTITPLIPNTSEKSLQQAVREPVSYLNDATRGLLVKVLQGHFNAMASSTNIPLCFHGKNLSFYSVYKGKCFACLYCMVRLVFIFECAETDLSVGLCGTATVMCT